ncbi:alanine dehydrogenase [Mangrovibacterium sp.]|uniref:alanine dehydrogenase n=1 Tax=Mangrovibacterium sp. TaxID=1961364 RepID=UPI00356B07B1
MTEQENRPGIASWYMPQEEMLEIRRKGKKITIGIPSDFARVESRIPLTPEAVELLVSYGHEICIEKGAGKASSYSDEEYRNSGAIVQEKRADVFQCDIILRVSPFNDDDIDLLRGNQTLISNMQLNTHCAESVQKLMRKKVTAIAYEYLEDEENYLPVVHLMSQLSGSASIMVASEYLSNSRNGKGVLLGGVTGISPTELVILGATTAGEFAARAAIGLGASVKVFDNNILKLRKLEETLGHQVFTSVLYPNVLKKALKSADVVLGAMSVNKAPTFRVSKEMVSRMKKGSVIIDLNVSQGGCFETSRCTDLKNPTYTEYDVVHFCAPNISSLVARTASIALSNVLSPIIISVGEIGGIQNYIKSTKGFRKGIYIYNGILTNDDLGETLNLPSKDIDLLLAVF